MTGRRDHRMHDGNRFKLGLFGLNCSGGLTMTKAAEHWEASWDNNVKAAKLSEEAGLEFILPVARWHGYRGETDSEGTSLETLTWASGILAETKDLVAFGTVHVPLINPIFAAKQCITADHIGQGRFGQTSCRDGIPASLKCSGQNCWNTMNATSTQKSGRPS